LTLPPGGAIFTLKRLDISLNPGTELDPYEIPAPLGAGGMGEVHKTTDTRLDRIVALKVQPLHVSDNAHIKERFEREARAVSSLNHPYICTLYVIKESVPCSSRHWPYASSS
jgi:serine/threonine protein kinase